MSKSNQKQVGYHFGRVFFPGEPKVIPDKILFQPLGNHVGNVRKLVLSWNNNDFPSDSSLQRVKVAADIHDVGKPQQFKIQAETDHQGQFKKYIYSFRGHRFLAEHKDAWTQSLARGHHDFSVGDITRDAYELKKDSRYKTILDNNSLAYAKELYILEMCDQIEAELACKTFEDTKQAESRTFMEYTISHIEGNTYQIDPWIFSKETIKLTMKSWVFYLSDQDKAELKQCQQEGKDLGEKLDALVKKWWQNCQGKPEEEEEYQVKIQPHQSKELEEVKDCKDCQFWYQELAGFTPNPMQQEVFDKMTQNNDDLAVLLKAPTGSGKLETILIPALAKGYSLILPLPARSLIDDHRQRVEKYLQLFSQFHPNKEVSFVIDTGFQMYRYVYLNGEKKPRTNNPRRHLYKGNIILTTLDKFLYRYFAYGDQQKSFIYPLRIHQETTLICFDEAHSYDEIAFTNFKGLVQSLYEAGRSMILMTATMPKEYIDRFDYLDVIDYVDNNEKRQALVGSKGQPERSFEWINDLERNSKHPENFQKRVSETITTQWQLFQGKRRILTVVERVQDAVEVYKELKQELDLESNSKVLFLYHGRLDAKVREEVYQNIKNRDNEGLPYILITTSAIEVGCDLNSETLISEICLPENLIQRVGRCNRKGNVKDAKVILIGKINPNQIPFYAQSLNEKGWKDYQEALSTLTAFDSEVVNKCIARSGQIDDYRVVELFSMLHDYVYSADLTCQSTHEKGLIVTRSWTPSVTLVYDSGKHDELKQMPQVTVPIDRLIKPQNAPETSYNIEVLEEYYDKENTRWTNRSLTWGCAYSKSIIVKINPPSYEEGNKVIEYPYSEELGFVELPKIFIYISRNSKFDTKLLYKPTKTNHDKGVIISYVKSINPN